MRSQLGLFICLSRTIRIRCHDVHIALLAIANANTVSLWNNPCDELASIAAHDLSAAKNLLSRV